MDAYDLVEIKKAEAANKNQVGLTRRPIRENLMALSRGRREYSMKPVKKKGTRTPKGWRDFTVGQGLDYGKKAWQLAKHIATLINVEEKVFDVDGSGGIVITSTPTVVNLTNIAQGSDYFNRVGDSILLQGIEFRARVNSNTAAGADWMRVLIVRDKLQRGVDPVLGDVLQGGTSPSVQPYLEPQDQRFDVLYDHLIEINSPGVGLATSGSSTTYMPHRVVLPPLVRKYNVHVKYQNTTGADASNWIGGLYLMAVAGDATNGPNLSYAFRVRFTDN